MVTMGGSTVRFRSEMKIEKIKNQGQNGVRVTLFGKNSFLLRHPQTGSGSQSAAVRPSSPSTKGGLKLFRKKNVIQNLWQFIFTKTTRTTRTKSNNIDKKQELAARPSKVLVTFKAHLLGQAQPNRVFGENSISGRPAW